MSKPTCRELIDLSKQEICECERLAARVERVLSLEAEATEADGYSEGYCWAIRKVVLLLNGEEPPNP